MVAGVTSEGVRGQKNPQKHSYTHDGSTWHLGCSIFRKETVTGWLQVSADWSNDHRVSTTAVKPSVCPVIIDVQICYERAACGTASRGCMVCLSGTSRVDRLWLPCKTAHAEGCGVQINVELCVKLCRRKWCTCGLKGARAQQRPDEKVHWIDMWLPSDAATLKHFCKTTARINWSRTGCYSLNRSIILGAFLCVRYQAVIFIEQWLLASKAHWLIYIKISSSLANAKFLTKSWMFLSNQP